MLERIFDEVGLEWDDWLRFKVRLKYFIDKFEILYRVSQVDNLKDNKEKEYFQFRDKSNGDESHGWISRIHKTNLTYYKFMHINALYNKQSINPLALTLHCNISNFIFRDTSTPLSEGLTKF
jgi:hypothetical protein